MSNSDLDVIILAAGKGTRMNSATPKVLHRIAGRSMINHVLDTAAALNPTTTTVVVGYQSDEVAQQLPESVSVAVQTEQNGTGHAVVVGLQETAGAGVVLVLYGDVPLVTLPTLQAAVAAGSQGNIGLVTACFDDPAQLGRIVRDDSGQIKRIVEYRDADDATRAIREINSGIMALPGPALRGWLQELTPQNSQGEYYLTDVIAMAVRDGVCIEGIPAAEAAEVMGVNDRAQLAEVERLYQHREANRLMAQGVTIADPARIDIRGNVTAAPDTFIDINVVLTGEVNLGRGVRIGPGAVIEDCEIGDGSVVHAHTVVEGAHLKDGVSVGPFARIRPGSVLEDGVKVGNFVETKKAHLGRETKASHLAYLGDATIGADCNIGAGAVTCNYDGVNKHETQIGDGVFIGTNATMVAPIQIGDDAFVAAGSTVTTKVGDKDLAVGRAKQRNIKGWLRPDQRKS